MITAIISHNLWTGISTITWMLKENIWHFLWLLQKRTLCSVVFCFIQNVNIINTVYLSWIDCIGLYVHGFHYVQLFIINLPALLTITPPHPRRYWTKVEKADCTSEGGGGSLCLYLLLISLFSGLILKSTDKVQFLSSLQSAPLRKQKQAAESKVS